MSVLLGQPQVLRRGQLVLGTTLSVAAFSVAQDHAKADPEHAKVVAETDQVRVLRYHYAPHQKSAQHSHPDKTVDVALGPDDQP
jgi:quercetin dioxygenase-like cupin family protein